MRGCKPSVSPAALNSVYPRSGWEHGAVVVLGFLEEKDVIRRVACFFFGRRVLVAPKSACGQTLFAIISVQFVCNL